MRNDFVYVTLRARRLAECMHGMLLPCAQLLERVLRIAQHHARLESSTDLIPCYVLPLGDLGACCYNRVSLLAFTDQECRRPAMHAMVNVALSAVHTMPDWASKLRPSPPKMSRHPRK